MKRSSNCVGMMVVCFETQRYRGRIMATRRNMLKGMAAGAAVCGVSGTAVYTSEVAKSGWESRWADGVAPWWLIAPLGVGTALAFGWYVGGLGPVVRGASVLTLKHASGQSVELHLCTYRDTPRGIAHSGLIDIVMMDGRFGDRQTDERIGRIILGIAKIIANNELNPSGDLLPLAEMFSHDERKERYGPEAL